MLTKIIRFAVFSAAMYYQWKYYKISYRYFGEYNSMNSFAFYENKENKQNK